VTWGFLWALQARGKTKYAKHIPPARFYCIGGFDFAFAFRPHPAGVDCAAGLRWMMLTLQVQLIVWFHLMSHLPLLLASSCSPWVRQFPPHQWHQCVVIVPSSKVSSLASAITYHAWSCELPPSTAIVPAGCNSRSGEKTMIVDPTGFNESNWAGVRLEIALSASQLGVQPAGAFAWTPSPRAAAGQRGPEPAGAPGQPSRYPPGRGNFVNLLRRELEENPNR